MSSLHTIILSNNYGIFFKNFSIFENFVTKVYIQSLMLLGGNYGIAVEEVLGNGLTVKYDINPKTVGGDTYVDSYEIENKFRTFLFKAIG